MLLWPIIAVELTSSSTTQNHVVFQPINEQARKQIERILQFSFEVDNN